MKKQILSILLTLFVLSSFGYAQTNGQKVQTQIKFVTALPATCVANQGLLYGVIGASPIHYHICVAANTFVDVTAAGSSTPPAGADTQIQRNNAGAFGAVTGATSTGTNITFSSGNLIATRPKFITSIDDTNGNEIFKVTATGSAVNELTVANAATGSNPSVTASGDDTNVGQTYAVKGLGKVSFLAPTIIQPVALSTGAMPEALKVTAANHTGITASSEAIDVYFNLNRSLQRATGNVTTDRAVLFEGRTITFVGASTVTDEVNVYVGSNTCGTNATCTRSTALYSKPGVTTHHGIWADHQVSATGDSLRIGLSGVPIIRFNNSGGTTNSVFNDNGALSASATDGFQYISRIDSASNPSGTPTSYNGSSPIVLQSDTVGGNYRLWAFLNSAWRNLSGSGTVLSFSCVTANGVSCSVANPTTTPAATFTLGAITPISNDLSGTAGSGFVGFAAQSSAPSAPAGGLRLYADSSGRLSWIRASDGFTRTFDVTLTANRTWNLIDANDTFAFLGAANVFTGLNTFTSAVTTGSGSTAGTVFNYNLLTTGVGMNLASTSTAGSSTTSSVLNISRSGAQTGTVTTTAGTIANTATGASATNVALTLTASGATTANNAFSVTAGRGVFTAAGAFNAQHLLFTSPSPNQSLYVDSASWVWRNESTGGILQLGFTNKQLFVASDFSIGFSSSTSTSSGSPDLFLRRAAAANLAFGAADAASPVAQTTSVQSVVAGTSNTAGVAWTLKGSASTGNGLGGIIDFQTTTAGGSGTSQNTYSSKFTVNSTGIAVGGGGTITKTLVGSATLDFGNLATLGCEDLTITITGAANGDAVILGVPNASIIANSNYTAWVSATDTVTVRFCTLVSGDPASGTFKAIVVQQ
jgi:hypothetical protein